MAQRAMKILMDMQMQDLVEIRGEKSDSNVISTFVSVFAKFKCVNRLALITCDRKLAKQIEALNNDEMGGFHILVLKYENGKGFRKWQEEDFQDKESIEKIYINSENIQEQNKDDELKGLGSYKLGGKHMEGDSKHKKDEYARNVLENYAKNYKIFLDTCSILEPAIDKFWRISYHFFIDIRIKLLFL